MKTYTNLKITLTAILFMVCSISGYLVGQTSSEVENSSDELTTNFKYVSPDNMWTRVGYSVLDNKYSTYRFRFSPDSIFFEGHWYFQLQGSGSDSGDNWGNEGLFREENGVVYGIIQNEEHIFMDFNLEIGDEISIPSHYSNDSTEFIVTEVDSLELLDGSLRKRLFLECKVFAGYGIYFVEGLGSFYNNIGYAGCLSHSDYLLCFYHDGEKLYIEPHSTKCWITTSVTDIQAQGIIIYPNPTTDFLTIEFEDPPAQDIKFKVYEYTGKLIRNFQYSGFQSHYRLQVSDLSPGLYYLSWELDGKPYVYHFVMAK